MQVYTASQGRQQGPYTIEQINTALSAGQLTQHGTLAWYEGSPNWIPLSQVPGVTGNPPTNAGGVAPPPVPVQTQAAFPPQYPQQQVEGSSVIPTSNPSALTSYYLGIFGLIPFFGFFLAIPAVIFGVIGYKRYRRNPLIKGAAHAWIAIILGALSIIGHVLVIVAIATAAAGSR